MHTWISVKYLQVHSDEFLPSHISTSINIKYESLDFKALVNNPRRPTGASRYFNWVGRYIGCCINEKGGQKRPLIIS